MDIKSDSMTTNIVLGLVALLVIYFIYSKLTSGVKSVFTGEAFKSDAEKEGEKEAEESARTINWIAKAQSLPVKQRAGWTVAYAKSSANSLYNYLKGGSLSNPLFISGTNEVVRQLKTVPTEGALYYLINYYGIKEGKDLITTLRERIGYNNKLADDLDDVNQVYKNRGFKFLL